MPENQLVLILSVFAGICLLTGGVIVSLQTLRKPSPFPFLIVRGIDPHLWGCNLLGAGFMLSLVLMMLDRTPWSREGLAGRAIVSAAVVWTVVALVMSVAAVLTPARAGMSVSLFPAPEAKLTTWPSPYRAFLVLGFAALCVLGIMVF